jgi:NIPSNAP
MVLRKHGARRGGARNRDSQLAAIADALRWLPSALIAGGLTEPLGATEAQRRSNYGE